MDRLVKDGKCPQCRKKVVEIDRTEVYAPDVAAELAVEHGAKAYECQHPHSDDIKPEPGQELSEQAQQQNRAQHQFVGYALDRRWWLKGGEFVPWHPDDEEAS